MARKIRSFRVGKVAVYLRGKIWYLCYHENGQRRRPRVGGDKAEPNKSYDAKAEEWRSRLDQWRERQ